MVMNSWLRVLWDRDLVSLKIRRVEGLFHVKSVLAQSFLLSVVVWRGCSDSDNMLIKYQMIKFIDFCEVSFLPESVARVAAIVGDHRCHSPRH
ncbi:hypothetical protein TNCV_3897401 [Trichonephila clavipes]|nr:hypothetical protein TNCV_3897401 [Trichonephila clavipes]